MNDFSKEMGELFFFQKGINNSSQLDYLSPDLTSKGFLDKRWIIENKERYLCKNGHDLFRQQPFNEKVASDVLECIGCRDYVQYTLRGLNEEEPYSVCKDFITENMEYIPASLLRKSLEKHPGEKEYAYFMRCCEKLNLKNL